MSSIGLEDIADIAGRNNNFFARHFGEFVSTRAKGIGNNELLGSLASLLTYLQSEGHVCLDLGNPPVVQDGDSFKNVILPPLTEITQELEPFRDTLISFDEVSDTTPFILQNGRYLYLSRYWQYEQDVKTRVVELLGSVFKSKITIPEDLFPGQAVDSAQSDAVAKALHSSFSIIAGGPGTGKTTIAVKILAALLKGDPEARIALAAPTGKAAARMKESIALNINSLDVNDAIKSIITGMESFTLHRVLGARYKSPYFKHDRDNPLPYDLLIVDESSMIDLPMMAKLLDAIGPGTSVVLIGDPDQLPPVEIGSIFGQLVHSDPIRRCLTTLTINYRAKESPDIIELCKCINIGDGDRAIQLLQKESDQVHWQPVSKFSDVDKLAKLATASYRSLFESEDVEKSILQQINQFRVLSALRKGPFGSETINSRIRSLIGTGKELIMVTRNDAENGIFNGDIGININRDGNQAVWIEGKDFPISPLRIPEYQISYAMTGHKAQGSEFDEVHIILPADEHCPLLTREWLYTAVSRARKSVTIWASEVALKKCLNTCVKRSSGMSF